MSNKTITEVNNIFNVDNIQPVVKGKVNTKVAHLATIIDALDDVTRDMVTEYNSDKRLKQLCSYLMVVAKLNPTLMTATIEITDTALDDYVRGNTVPNHSKSELINAFIKDGIYVPDKLKVAEKVLKDSKDIFLKDVLGDLSTPENQLVFCEGSYIQNINVVLTKAYMSKYPDRLNKPFKEQVALYLKYMNKEYEKANNRMDNYLMGLKNDSLLDDSINMANILGVDRLEWEIIK